MRGLIKMKARKNEEEGKEIPQIPDDDICAVIRIISIP